MKTTIEVRILTVPGRNRDKDGMPEFNLQSATDFESRFRALQEFMTSWGGPETRILDAEPPGDLPRPLGHFYKLTAPGFHEGRGGVGRQDRIALPEGLQREDGKIVFFHENQSVYSGATVPGEDPPVWFFDEDRGRRKFPEPLSRFLVTFYLHEAVLSARTRHERGALLPRVANWLRKKKILWKGFYPFGTSEWEFHRLNDNILAARIEGEWVLACNTEPGMSKLDGAQKPYRQVSLSTPHSNHRDLWSLDVKSDGSGWLCCGMAPRAWADIPPGTFEFQPILDFVLEQKKPGVVGGDCEVSLFREGIHSAPLHSVAPAALLRDCFKRGAENAIHKADNFEVALKKYPFFSRESWPPPIDS